MTENLRRKSVADQYYGSWMKPEVLASLPQLGRDYQRHSDPERHAMYQHFAKPDTRKLRESVSYEAKAQKYRIVPNQQTTTRVFNLQDEQSSGEGQGEQSGDSRGSSMVAKQHPKANLRPPEHIARPVDQSNFKYAWMREQRDAVMAQAKSTQQDQFHQHTHNQPQAPNLRGPER
ncbi:hypothetical protein [Lentilitoribacter sp. EG35]|uniref:hypothetical protein n=1 Tax=Lentilitoribacter sp. EG35 TaxID=3234192 RepID=UPI0034610DC7